LSYELALLIVCQGQVLLAQEPNSYRTGRISTLALVSAGALKLAAAFIIGFIRVAFGLPWGLE
jgi:hypothetical protein